MIVRFRNAIFDSYTSNFSERETEGGRGGWMERERERGREADQAILSEY